MLLIQYAKLSNLNPVQGKQEYVWNSVHFVQSKYCSGHIALNEHADMHGPWEAILSLIFPHYHPLYLLPSNPSLKKTIMLYSWTDLNDTHDYFNCQ